MRIEVDAATGTFSVDGQPGFGRLVDDGDEGDTYNWCPPADDDVVDRPDAVQVEVIESGPLRAALVVRATYTWPERIESGARIGERQVEVDTRLELHAGERLVRVTTELDNPSRDHRLRVWFPLPEPAVESSAECAFAVVTRGLVAEGGPTEAPLATYPSRRFVQAGGLTVVHEGLLEYELVDLADRCLGHRAGRGPRPHAAAGHRLHLPGTDGDTTPAGRPGDPGRGPADDRAPPRALRDPDR